MLRRSFSFMLALAFPALAADPPFTTSKPAPAVEDFSFIHISDIHIEPHLARTGPPGSGRGAETIRWICREAAGPQNIAGVDTPVTAPSFGLATGDLTEYGVIDDTFSVFEAAFAPLPIPLYVVPGNHDNTWVAMYEVMRRRHGGENYSFEQSGCHFVCLCTASPQEPVPTIDAKTRAWLRRDLARVAPGTPIFVALHHPPYSGEFAAPAEYDTFIDRLKDFNVVLLLYGHGHAVDHRRMDGIDGVMGGSTFGKNAGYNLVSVRDGRLRVQYHYHHNAGGSAEAPSAGRRRTLLDKPIRRTVPQRLFRIHKPRDGDTARQDRLDIALQMAVGERAPAASNLSVRIDGEEVEFNRTPGDQPAGWRVDVGGLTPGGHLLTVRLTTAEGGQGHVGQDLRTRTFFIDRDPIHPRWRVEFPAAVKAGPVVVGDHVVVARTDGVVVALDRRTGQVVWTFATGGEILGTPAWSGQLLVFGSGDGSVYALDESGQRVWVFEAGAPVYGPPLIDAGLVFIGDNGGRLHALDLGTGRPRWTFERADYAIESQPHRWGDLVVFGAWDGYLYAVQRRDAELAWKVPGPKSSEGKGVRYYAPADCGPVALGDLLFVCDRGYQLGAYSADGSPGNKWLEQVSAIAPDASGQYLLARTTDDRVCKFDATGKKVWETTVAAGRFPIPPTVANDHVYVCSNQGRLSVLDATDGRVTGTYQVTPGFYVMAPVAVDSEGCCYVAGMDGSVTAVETEGGRPGGGR